MQEKAESGPAFAKASTYAKVSAYAEALADKTARQGVEAATAAEPVKPGQTSMAKITDFYALARTLF